MQRAIFVRFSRLGVTAYKFRDCKGRTFKDTTDTMSEIFSSVMLCGFGNALPTMLAWWVGDDERCPALCLRWLQTLLMETMSDENEQRGRAKAPDTQRMGVQGWNDTRPYPLHIYVSVCLRLPDTHDGGTPYRSQYLTLPRACYMFWLRLTSKDCSTASTDKSLKTNIIKGLIEVGIEGKSLSVTDKKKRRIAPPSFYHVSVNSLAPSLNLASGSLLIVRVCSG